MKTIDTRSWLEKLMKTCLKMSAALAPMAAATEVNVEALRMARRQSPSLSPVPYGNAALSREQETALVVLAQAFSSNKMPRPALQLRDSMLQK